MDQLLINAKADFLTYVKEQGLTIEKFEYIFGAENETNAEWDLAEAVWDFCNNYKVYNSDLWELAEVLYDAGYSILEQEEKSLDSATMLTFSDWLQDQLMESEA